MRQLLPFPCDPVDAAALYGDLPSARTRPAVRLNMIASIDGATAVAGVSGGLGGPADQFALHDGHPQACVGQSAGRVLAGRPGPDHQHVVCVRHEVIPPPRHDRCRRLLLTESRRPGMCYSANGVTPDAAGATMSHHGPLSGSLATGGD